MATTFNGLHPCLYALCVGVNGNVQKLTTLPACFLTAQTSQPASPTPPSSGEKGLPTSAGSAASPPPETPKTGQDSGGWKALAAHPLFWILCGVLPALLLAVWFAPVLRCALEFRITEATVALIVLLAAGAAGALRLAPEAARARLQLFYAGFSIMFLAIILVTKVQPPPDQETCLPDSRRTEAPGSADLSTEPPPTTPKIQDTAPTIATQTPACAASHHPIQGMSIAGAVEIVDPLGECVWVDKQQNIPVRWEGVTEDTYTLWTLVYSPLNQKYYPRPCGREPLPTRGERACQARFEKPEPYEIILLLADAQAAQVLEDLAAGASQSDLPGGVAEKAAQRVVRK